MMNKWPKQSECDSFYGDPRGKNAQASPKWESENLVRVPPPFIMKYIDKPIKSIRIHRKCAPSLTRVLAAIWLSADKKQEQIDTWHVSIYGGSYNYRLMRNGNRLSMHSYGCAIDLAPNIYPMHDKEHKRFAAPVIKAFEDEGWVNLPDDRMHFQCAIVN